MRGAILQMTLGVTAIFLSSFLVQAKVSKKQSVKEDVPTCELGLKNLLIQEVKLSKACGAGIVKIGFLKLPKDTYQMEACIPQMKVKTGVMHTYKASSVSFKVVNATDRTNRDITEISRLGRDNTKLHFTADHSRIVYRTLGMIETKLKDGGYTEDCSIFIDHLGDKGQKVTISSKAAATITIDTANIPTANDLSAPKEIESADSGTDGGPQ